MSMGRAIYPLLWAAALGAAVWCQGILPHDDVPEAVGEDAEEVGEEVVVSLRREAVVA